MADGTDLGNLEPGRTAVVVDIRGGARVTSRLDAMGIRPGVVLEKIVGQPFGGPVVVQVGRSRLALGLGMAKKVCVEADVCGGAT